MSMSMYYTDKCKELNFQRFLLKVENAINFFDNYHERYDSTLMYSVD